MPRLLNREEIEGCVSHVEGYASSGLSVQAYASAHGLEARKLQAWTTHARRWRARLSAIESSPQPPVAGQRRDGFVRVEVNAGESVQSRAKQRRAVGAGRGTPPVGVANVIRIECVGARGTLVVAWPLEGGRDVGAQPAACSAGMIRIDSLWLAVEPVDMRAGADQLLARVVQVFGCAQAHHGYLFANARCTRIKLLVHDGFGVWCAARRLNQSQRLVGHAGV